MNIRKFIKEVLLESLNSSDFDQEIKVDISLPKDIDDIHKIFKKNGLKLYVVGGSIRDFLMGKKPKDFDLATDAHPENVIKILSPHYKVLETGKAFGVINVITSSDEYEIATFRKDIGKGRRPDSVEFSDISTDVKRRDLTINALFYDIDKKVIVDLVGGVEDIKKNIVRTVGEPSERFDEDKLRKIRAFRFAARMGAELDSETANAIKKDNSLEGVSRERIRDEFLKGILSAKSVVAFIEMLDKFKMLDWIFYGLKLDPPVEERNVPILLAFILKGNKVNDIKKQLNLLKYTSSEINKIIFLISFINLTPENALSLKKSYKISGLSDDEILRFSNLIDMDRKLALSFNKFEPSISGKDLIALGLREKELGDEINRLESEKFKDIYRKI